MGNVIQVTFDPTLWTAGSEGTGTTAGCNGYDAYSVFVDSDGVTGWAFEYSGNGFGRFNLSDGSMVHQDALMGTPGYNSWFNGPMYQGNVSFFQDNAGHYFLGYTDNILYKFHIGSGGTAGTILNGYEVVDGTFDLSTLPGSFGLADMILFQNGGVNYIGACSAYNSYLYVINADTMTFVGSYQTVDNTADGFQVFADSSHTLWGMFNYGANYDMFCVNWDPANGATSGALNSVTESGAVTQTNTGMRYNAEECCYIPSTNSVLMVSNVTDTSDAVVVPLNNLTAPLTPATVTTQGITFSALGGQNGVTIQFVANGAPDGVNYGGFFTQAAIIVNFNNDYTNNDVFIDILKDDEVTIRTVDEVVALFSTYNAYCTATGMNPITATGSGATPCSVAGPVSMTGGSPVRYDNLTFAETITFNSTLAAFDQGVQGGTLLMEGASGLPQSSGGVMQVIDPSTLTIINAYDVSALINDDPTLTPLTLYESDGTACIIVAVQEYSGSNIAFIGVNNIFGLDGGGFNPATPPLEIFNCIGSASFLNGYNHITVRTSFESPWYLNANDSASHGAFGPQDVITGNSKVAIAFGNFEQTTQFCGLAWNKTANRALATFFNSVFNSSVGSLVYIVTTAAPQASQVMVTASPNPAGGPTVPVTLPATVTGVTSSFPTSGTVSFYDGVTLLGSASVNGSGIATLSGQLFSLGSHSITAYFSGGS